ncbi:extracellular solute-binding protein [Paenibacillus sp. TAB 01]|uniref:extracellular solute-binding protein n=1 Tax=Paenibacillus sp. TAB 01 TaxID=3368988 RepID=UPI003752DEE7
MMNKQIKRWGLLSVTALTAVSLAACGAAPKAESGSAAGGAAAGSADKPVKLRIVWWGSQARHDATLKALDAYTKKHPNVTFEPEFSGFDGYADKLATQAAAKNAPDIIQIEPGLAVRIQRQKPAGRSFAGHQHSRYRQIAGRLG